MPVYVWSWIREDGSNRRIEINTVMGVEVARERACELFKDDTDAQEYIKNNEPLSS